jgi:hypothetical protein
LVRELFSELGAVVNFIPTQFLAKGDAEARRKIHSHGLNPEQTPIGKKRKVREA